MSDQEPKKMKMTLTKQHSLTGWAFLTPAVLLIVIFSFYPMIRAFMLSFQAGPSFKNMHFVGFQQYIRMFQDKIFMRSLLNTFIYLIVQVPVMLFIALILASMLNSKNLRGKGIFRTLIFLPCATSLVSYSLIFRSLFAQDGFINDILIGLGWEKTGFAFLSTTWSAQMIIILALIWRWTGYNMIFYLSSLQNIDYSIYEAAKIDGASPTQCFIKITLPLLRPIILLTAIMSTNGTLQLFDESVNLTGGGPSNTSMTMSHYIYNCSFKYVANFGYSCAMSIFVLILVAVLAMIQMEVGDKRD